MISSLQFLFRSARIFSFILLLSILAVTPAGFSGTVPTGEYQQAYLQVRKADGLLHQGMLEDASDTYRRALARLDEISNNYPGWNRIGIEKKADYCGSYLWGRERDVIGKHNSLPGRRLVVSFIDVGQGDSVLLECPDGQNILIDGGKSNAGKTVVNYLKERGVGKIDLLIATHPDSDHVGGLPDIIENFRVVKFMDPGKPHTSRYYEELLQLIKSKNIFYEQGRQGDIHHFGKVRMEILSPPDTLFPASNDCSVVAKVTYEEVNFLFTGDAAEESELRMLNKKRLSRCQILKVGHHGSRHSTGEYFLLPIKPEVAVISCGAGNSFGHPKREVMDRLDAVDCDFYRTDLQGDIRVETDGRRYKVILERKKPEKKKIVKRKVLNIDKFNINCARVDELIELPRIGPVKAARIVAYRQENGPFTSIEEIRNVSGIGPKTFERLQDLITVKLGKASAAPKKVASAPKEKKPQLMKKEEEPRLSYLKPTLIACRYPEITEEELNRRPEDEEITVDILNNDDYLPQLEKLFREARKSIYVVMFICNPGRSRSGPVNQLVDELIRARKRGVRVKVILDKSRTEDDFGARANEKAYRKLKREGLEVEYDYPKIKTHDKLAVIDEEYTVIGAHNWTEAALTDQNESAILIKSEAVAKDYLKYFYQLHDQTARFVKMGW